MFDEFLDGQNMNSKGPAGAAWCERWKATVSDELSKKLGDWLVKNTSNAGNTPIIDISDVIGWASMCDIDSDNYHVTSITSSSANQRSDLKVSTSPPIRNVGVRNGCDWQNIHNASHCIGTTMVTCIKNIRRHLIWKWTWARTAADFHESASSVGRNVSGDALKM